MNRLTLAFSIVALLAACAPADDAVVAHGTVEIREMDIAPSAPARVVRVLVDEGDSVAADDTLAIMTQATLPADVAAMEARLTTAQAQLRELEAGARAPEVARARAELRGIEAEVERTARDLERMQALADAGAVSRQELDAARTAARTAASRRDAARETLELLEQGTRPERIRAARGEVASARAALDRARATVADLVLTAPSSGIVLGRHADPGEQLSAGIPVVTVGRASEPWVRVYVPADALPVITLGQTVSVRVPGVDRELAGRVSTINTRAEFTPRVALTDEERADQLFGVRVEVRGEPALKPGMPAEVRFRAPAGSSGSAEAIAP